MFCQDRPVQFQTIALAVAITWLLMENSGYALQVRMMNR
jgi:hypothetical protein